MNKDEFLKWYEYYQSHLKKMYKMLLNVMKQNYRISEKHSYTSFCYFIYKNSSKRIPLY